MFSPEEVFLEFLKSFFNLKLYERVARFAFLGQKRVSFRCCTQKETNMPENQSNMHGESLALIPFVLSTLKFCAIKRFCVLL